MTGSIRGRWLRTRTFVAVASGAVVLATGAATERRTPSSSRRPNPARPGPRGTTGELLGVYDARVGAGGAARAAQLRTASKAARTRFAGLPPCAGGRRPARVRRHHRHRADPAEP